MSPSDRPVSCDEWQRRISDALDTLLAPHDAELAAHLAACPACAAFQRVLAALDSRLMAQARPAVLPQDFKARLLERVAAVPRLTTVEFAARREQLEREHLAAINALERRHLVPQGRQVLRVLTVAATLVLAAVLAPWAAVALSDAAAMLREAGGASRPEMFACLAVIAALAWWQRRSVPVLRCRRAWRATRLRLGRAS